MPTATCASCSHELSILPGGARPPWCPKCGKDFKERPAEQAPPAPPAAGAAFLGADFRKGASLPQVQAMTLPPDPERERTYTATIQLRCWKQHTCSACACVYRYRFERSGKGDGGLEDLAVLNAERKLVHKLRSSVDVSPCPTCGLIQPDMAAKSKLLWHGVATALALVVLGVIAVQGFLGGLPIDRAGVQLAIVGGVAGVIQLLIALVNVNADRPANLEKATAAVEAGKVQVVKAGELADLRDPPPNLTLVHGLALLAALAAPLAFLWPVFARPADGWPLNPPDGARAEGSPRMIAPGDQVSVRLQAGGVQSVKGLWRGTPKVEVLNAAELGCPPTLTGTGRDDSWDEGIWTKSRDKRRSLALTAQFAIPNDAALAGKSLQARITLPVTYPALKGFNQFMEAETSAIRNVTILLAPGEVKQAYLSSWQNGLGLGLLGTVGGGFILVWLGLVLRNRAEPSEVVPVRPSLAEDGIGQAA